MIKFIEVDIANTESKAFINVSQIVNIGAHHNREYGYISFNSSSANNENYILTKQNYEELKQLIKYCMEN